MAVELLNEFVCSEDAGTRYDALSIVRRFHIRETTVGLDRLTQKLSRLDSAPARDELEKVREIRALLDGPSP